MWFKRESQERVGIYVYVGLIHAVVQHKLPKHCQAIILQFFLIEK